MMGIVVSETCWASNKCNKIKRSMYLVLFSFLFSYHNDARSNTHQNYVSEFKVRMRFPQGCDYKYWKPCNIAAKYRSFGETAVFTLILSYVSIRALNQALQSPLLIVAFHFNIRFISTWRKKLGLETYWYPHTYAHLMSHILCGFNVM